MSTSNALVKVEKLKELLSMESVAIQFQNSLKENSGAFVASVIELYVSDSYLQNCEPKEVIMEALKAASLKLPINKNLGFAWIIPRKIKGKLKPCFDIGYKGYIQLAMRTSQYRIINADKIPVGINVKTDLLTGIITVQKTEEKAKKDERPQGYFAHFELLNGFAKTLYVTREKMEEHRELYVPDKTEYSPWATPDGFDKMAIKTVLAHLLNTYGILSTEMVLAFAQTINDYISPKEIANRTGNILDMDIEPTKVIKEKEKDHENEEKKDKLPEEFE